MKLPAFLLLLFLAASVAKAGTGPETTLLVVNADSPLSLTLANQWLETRPIPRSHVVWLHGIPNLGTISMEGFRSRILEPVQGFLKEEGLTEEIDTIVYSADFPYAVALASELKRLGVKRHRYIGNAASLTGLTYFSNLVLEGNGDYLAMNSNGYFRQRLKQAPGTKTQPLSAEDRKTLQKAKNALKKGDSTTARSLLQEILKRYSNNPSLHFFLAEILATLGQRQVALEQLKQAHALGWSNGLVPMSLT